MLGESSSLLMAHARDEELASDLGISNQNCLEGNVKLAASPVTGDHTASSWPQRLGIDA
jgi:hypothetical protein